MCFECEGLKRKPIQSGEDYEIYRGGGWEELEESEREACRRKRLAEIAKAERRAMQQATAESFGKARSRGRRKL